MRAARDLQVQRDASPAELRGAGLTDLAPAAPRLEPPAPAVIDPASSRAPRPPAGTRLDRYVAPPFASGQVDPAALGTFPYTANGKVYGVFRGYGGYSCSATVIATSSRSVAITAGHCLYDESAGWARRVVFIPAYENGNRPFGTWTFTRETVPRGWRRGNFHLDYGAVKLTSPSGPVGAVVGEEGLTWDQPREQLFQPIGYPNNLGQTELMWNCFSGTGGVDPVDRSSGNLDTGIGCDMGSGSSGGGWTIRDAAGSPFVNGVTSYGYRKLKNVLFAAYLTSGVLKTVNQANRG